MTGICLQTDQFLAGHLSVEQQARVPRDIMNGPFAAQFNNRINRINQSRK